MKIVKSINYDRNSASYFDFTFGAKWIYLPLIRNNIENFLLVNNVENFFADKVKIAASELLENAVNLSSRGGIRLIFNKISSKKILIKVLNKLNKRRAADLISYIQDMNNDDPMNFYLQRLKESSFLNKNKAFLGFAKIYYESNATIDIDYLDDEKVVVVSCLFNINKMLNNQEISA